jgi:uncharacterized protein (DUF3084 family)
MKPMYLKSVVGILSVTCICERNLVTYVSSSTELKTELAQTHQDLRDVKDRLTTIQKEKNKTKSSLEQENTQIRK